MRQFFPVICSTSAASSPQAYSRASPSLFHSSPIFFSPLSLTYHSSALLLLPASFSPPSPCLFLSCLFSFKKTKRSYDIGVTGGVTSMPAFLSSFFPSVAAQQQAASTSDARSPYCKFDSPVLQLFTSSLFLAGLVSSLVASGVTRR